MSVKIVFHLDGEIKFVDNNLLLIVDNMLTII